MLLSRAHFSCCPSDIILGLPAAKLSWERQGLPKLRIYPAFLRLSLASFVNSALRTQSPFATLVPSVLGAGRGVDFFVPFSTHGTLPSPNLAINFSVNICGVLKARKGIMRDIWENHQRSSLSRGNCMQLLMTHTAAPRTHFIWPHLCIERLSLQQVPRGNWTSTHPD